MEAFHKLKVESPYEILEIEDIKISNNPNEHGRLYLKALLDDSINFKYAIEASTDDKISIYEETEDKEKSIIFNGTIQNIRTENINGIYYMEIEAYTSSFELDIKEKSRSFQDAEMSYDDLIKTILLDYKIYSFTQRMDKPMSIGRPLFQYKETDYEFLKRVASQIGLEINCDIINTNNVFYFGRPWGKEYKIEDNIDYEALKDIKKYRESLVHSPNFHDTDFFYYKIRTRKLMELGAQVVFKQKKFYINSYEAEYVRGELIYTYKLCRERGIWQEKLYNDKIKGISLEGEVLEVSGEKVKLNLDIDETQNKDKAAWFRYAPPTGNLMYSMPIVGTNANLYFSSERSEDPIVIGCIRKNGSSCESFSDVNNRYFATESGNNLDMLPGAINFSRPGLSANFNDGSGINLSSSSSLNISAGYVGIYAGDITIKAKSKLEAKKGESSFISLENDFYNNAGIVMENGSDKASNGAFDDDPQKGAAEAKAALEIMMNEAALVAANEGANATLGILASDSSLVPMNNSSIPLEGKELEERSDIPDFDRFQEYDENQYVKKQMDDGTYVLGTAYRPDNKNVSIFTACDKEAVSEHTSLISELKSCGYGLLGAANRFIESMSEDQKKRDFEFQLIINKNASKYGIDCPSEYMGFETKGKTVDELMNEWKENNAEWRNNNLRNNAPCKYLYDGSEIAGDIVIPFLPIGKGPLMWCGTKKVSVAKSGIKVASELKNGKALTESEIIASSGVGNLKGTYQGAGNRLLKGEGNVGTYKELIDAGKRGDNLTPHHMPSAEYMKNNGVSKNNGISMNMEQPATGGRHRLTDTYGRNMTDAEKANYYGLSSRDALAHDLWNAREIYIQQGKYTPEIREGLLDVIKRNKSDHPNLFNK